MSNETLARMTREYRDHYIRVRVTSEEWATETDEVTATVRVFDGHPGGQLFGNAFAGDVVESFEAPVPRFHAEDAIEDLLVKAKEFIDTEKVNQHSAQESIQIAMERQLEGDDDA